MVAIAIKITGIKAVRKLIPKEGISFSANVLLSNNPLGGLATIFLMNSGNTIPAINKVGMAIINPNSKVLPMSALKITAMAVGPG